MRAARSSDDRAGPRCVAAGGGVRALLCALGWVLLASCDAYDSGLVPSDPLANGGRGGAGGMDAGAGEGGGGSGGQPQGGMSGCARDAIELCNRVDDDCDGTIDEGAEAVCEQTVLNAVAGCVPYGNGARCVLVMCREGFDRCDGNPANGCEPYCDCNDCEDAGIGEDGGVVE